MNQRQKLALIDRLDEEVQEEEIRAILKTKADLNAKREYLKEMREIATSDE